MFTLKYDKPVERDLKELSKHGNKVIKAFEKVLVEILENPTRFKMLEGNLSPMRTARFSKDYRIIYLVDEKTEEVYILAVGDRKNVYHIAGRR